MYHIENYTMPISDYKNRKVESFHGGIEYEYNLDKFSINLKLNNLTNEEYFNGWSTVNPQAPRNFAAALTYKF